MIADNADEFESINPSVVLLYIWTKKTSNLRNTSGTFRQLIILSFQRFYSWERIGWVLLSRNIGRGGIRKFVYEVIKPLNLETKKCWNQWWICNPNPISAIRCCWIIMSIIVKCVSQVVTTTKSMTSLLQGRFQLGKCTPSWLSRIELVWLRGSSLFISGRFNLSIMLATRTVTFDKDDVLTRRVLASAL